MHSALKNYITVYDDVLNSDYCRELIERFESNPQCHQLRVRKKMADESSKRDILAVKREIVFDATTTNYTKTYIYCECKTVTKWSEVSTDEWEEKEEYYIDKATGTKYILSNSTLSVISSSGTITINNFSNGQLGIHLGETEKIDKSDVTRDVFLEEDFCSPLILDINNNGTSSTRLNDSNVYFDMDGDGFKERTAWVEQGDGLLVLDRNGNGTIDNGTELFGNFTPLSSGNSASDGFEALLQYDENHDAKIDHNDAAYNELRVWMDDNEKTIYYVEDYNQIQSVFKHKDLAA